MKRKQPWTVRQHRVVRITLGPLVATSPRTGREVELSAATTMDTVPGNYYFPSLTAAKSFAQRRREEAGDPLACSEPYRTGGQP